LIPDVRHRWIVATMVTDSTDREFQTRVQAVRFTGASQTSNGIAV
jgi:hypothetical protein